MRTESGREDPCLWFKVSDTILSLKTALNMLDWLLAQGLDAASTRVVLFESSPVCIRRFTTLTMTVAYYEEKSQDSIERVLNIFDPLQ